MSPDLHAILVTTAKSYGISLNNYINEALEKNVEKEVYRSLSTEQQPVKSSKKSEKLKLHRRKRKSNKLQDA